MIGNIVANRRPSWHPALGAGPVQSIVTAGPGIAVSTAGAAGLLTAPLNVILPGIGIVLGAVIGSLFAAHAARVAGAKQENTVLNSLIPTVQQAVSSVFDHLNDGSAQPSDGIAALQTIEAQYWQAVSQVEHGPGQAGNSSQCVSVPGAGLHITGTPAVQDPPGSNFSSYGPAHFDRACTASCGVGCMWVRSWVKVGVKLIQAGGGQVTFDGVVGNKYGLSNYPSLSLSYTPPKASAISSAAAAAGVPASVTEIASSSVFGIPVWMLIAGLAAWKVLQ